MVQGLAIHEFPARVERRGAEAFRRFASPLMKRGQSSTVDRGHEKVEGTRCMPRRPHKAKGVPECASATGGVHAPICSFEIPSQRWFRSAPEVPPAEHGNRMRWPLWGKAFPTRFQHLWSHLIGPRSLRESVDGAVAYGTGFPVSHPLRDPTSRLLSARVLDPGRARIPCGRATETGCAPRDGYQPGARLLR